MDTITAFFTLLETKGILSIAFAVWAIVVWGLGRNILRKLDDVRAEMTQMHFKLGNRVTKIEGYLESKDDNFNPYRNGDK